MVADQCASCRTRLKIVALDSSTAFPPDTKGQGARLPPAWEGRVVPYTFQEQSHGMTPLHEAVGTFPPLPLRVHLGTPHTLPGGIVYSHERETHSPCLPPPASRAGLQEPLRSALERSDSTNSQRARPLFPITPEGGSASPQDLTRPPSTGRWVSPDLKRQVPSFLILHTRSPKGRGGAPPLLHLCSCSRLKGWAALLGK